MKKKLISHLKEYRINKEISQQELADMVDVRRETIIRLEKSAYNPSLQLAMDIANIFDVPVEKLFEFE